MYCINIHFVNIWWHVGYNSLLIIYSNMSRVVFCFCSILVFVVFLFVVQWNLSWETTAMRDHLSWRTTHFWQKDQHFNTTAPVTRDHLSWETTFWWLKGRSFKTGSTVMRLVSQKQTRIQAVFSIAKLPVWLLILRHVFSDLEVFERPKKLFTVVCWTSGKC